MVLFEIICVYIVASIILYLGFKYKVYFIFKPPKYKFWYYFLSLTWGLPLTLIGIIIAMTLLCRKKAPKKYGWNLYFELEHLNNAISFGLVVLGPINMDHYLKNHEHGHGLQNIYFGIFMPTVVGIPSIIRFWYRKILRNAGRPLNTAYDDIWFEGSATRSGYFLLNKLENKNE